MDKPESYAKFVDRKLQPLMDRISQRRIPTPDDVVMNAVVGYFHVIYGPGQDLDDPLCRSRLAQITSMFAAIYGAGFLDGWELSDARFPRG